MTYFLLMTALMLHSGGSMGQNKRIVLVFGTDQDLLEQQLKMLQKDNNGLTERDVVLKIVKPGHRLYKDYNIDSAAPFTVLLVGKDGGEKYRSASLLTAGKLFTLIDAMPMRQAEIRRTKNKSS